MSANTCDPDLHSFFLDSNLDKHREKIIEYGNIEGVNDLDDLDNNDLHEIGLSAIEKKRFTR